MLGESWFRRDQMRTVAFTQCQRYITLGNREQSRWEVGGLFHVSMLIISGVLLNTARTERCRGVLGGVH